MRRFAFGYASFGALALTALLAACGGGGSGSPVAPPGPTPAPSNARLVGLADGATAAYDRTEATTITVTTVGPGVPIVPVPSPTTTTIASTYRDSVTVTGNQSFGGASGVYDVRTSVTPTGSSSGAYANYSNVVDTYEGVVATPAGFDLVSYGFTSKQSGTTSFVSNDTSSSTVTSTNTVPLRLVQVPAGAPFDPVLAYTLTSSLQYSSANPPGVISSGPTSTTVSGRFALAADGSVRANSTSSSSDGSGFTFDETIAGPGLAGTQTFAGSAPNVSNTSTTITTGMPTASGAGYTVAYTIVRGGPGAPQPTATTVPLWYPDGPAQRPFTARVADRGVQTVPASCALPAGFPTSGEATETVRTSVDPFDGAVSSVDETRWDAANLGTLCSIAAETYTSYDPTTGLKTGVSTGTTTRALRAATVPAALRRHALAGAGLAIPFVLPPAQPRLPELTGALRRSLRTASKHR